MVYLCIYVWFLFFPSLFFVLSFSFLGTFILQTILDNLEGSNRLCIYNCIIDPFCSVDLYVGNVKLQLLVN